MEASERNVICMKWGRKYDASYVNKLYNMARRNLTVPHRFICFTDDPSGLAEGIESRPLPSDDLTRGTRHGAWNKVYNFRRPLDDLQGKVLFLDLDVIIVGNLDCFFEHPGEFCVIRDWDDRRGLTGNTSVYRFDAGAHPEVHEDFIADRQAICSRYRREQAYVTDKIREGSSVSYWPQEWCVSFKRQCLPPWPLNWFRSATIPPAARILVFHGDPNPDEAIRGTRVKLRRVRPMPILAEYWR